MKFYLILVVFSFCLTKKAHASEKNNRLDTLMANGFQLLNNDILDSALISYREAMKLAEKLGELEKKGVSQNNTGIIYIKQGIPKKALFYFQLAVETYQELGIDSLTAESYYNLGLNYKKLGFYTEALVQITKALKIFEAMKSQFGLAKVYSMLGNIENNLKNYDKAIDYHKQAIKKRSLLGDDYELSKSYLNLGQTLNDSGLYVEARKYLYKAEKLKFNLDKSTDAVNSLIGMSYLREKKLDSAQLYLFRSLAQRKAFDNRTKLAVTYRHLSALFLASNELNKSVLYLDSAFEIASLYSLRNEQINILDQQILLFQNYDQGENIFAKYDLLLALKDSVAKNKNQNDLALVESEVLLIRSDRELERKNSKIELQGLENETLNLKNIFLWISFAITLTFVLAVSIILFKLRKSKRQTEKRNEQLHESHTQIDFLHKELSHRTKNYYQMFGGLLKFDKSKTQNKEVILILENYIRRVEAMSQIQRYLLHSNYESQEVQLDLYLSDILSNISLVLNSNDKPVLITKNLETVSLDYDKAIRMALVMNEMISNSFEHAIFENDQPEIMVELMESEDNVVQITISDNGSGINLSEHKLSPTKGIGLMNMILKTVNGEISYQKKATAGTFVHVKVSK